MYNACEHSLISDKWGYIVSPNYPEEYDSKLQCASTLETPPSHLTYMWVIDIEVEARRTRGCYDYLVLVDPRNLVKHRYCGTVLTISEPLKMSTLNMTLTFKTDAAHEYRGFLIFFNSK